MLTLNDIRTDFKIENIDDVRDFVNYVIDKLKCNFNPDDSFSDLIDEEENDEAAFDKESAEYLDTINEKCFEVAGNTYYDIACSVLNKYIV